MLRKKQVVLNLMVVVALLVSLVGVLPAGASVAVDALAQAAAPALSIAPNASAGNAQVASKAKDWHVVDVSDPEVSSEPAIYMIRLADPPLAAYMGGINGFAATSPQVTGARKLNVNAPAARAYMSFLTAKQDQTLAAMDKALNRAVKVVHHYYATNNGFAISLTPAEAETVAQLPGVIFIQRDQMQQLLTDAGPEWIGANAVWDGSATGVATKGEGVIVGVVDTGINHTKYVLCSHWR